MSRPILAEYVLAGWALVPIPVGRKGPITKGWELRENCITDAETAEYLDGNIGLAHVHSGTCVIDLDDLAGALEWFEGRGVDLNEFLLAPNAVRIDSGRENRAKLLYRLEKPLPTFKMGPFEFRCASRDGATVQDVLPPSIHPETGKPYEWLYNDDMIADWRCPPALPAPIRALWEAQCKPDTKVVVARVRTSNLGWAREMLFRHDPDEDYDKWLKCGLALHDGTEGGIDGLDLWDEWSHRGKKYKGREDLETHWRSFHAHTTNPVTLASLRTDEPAHDDEFLPVTEEETASLPASKTSMTVREAIKSLRRDNDGRPLAVLPNILPILDLPELCGWLIAYDKFQDVLVCAPTGTDSWRPIKDTDYTAFRVWLEQNALFHPVSKDMVRDAIYYTAEDHKMDSAQVWISKLKWDGTPRIKNFFPTYMGTIAAPYEQSVGEYLWTALAGRVMAPGCQADMAIILVGEQGLGKSQGVKAMAPWQEAYVELRLDENDDTIARKLRGSLVAEIAELRGFGSAGKLEQIKAFMVRTHEEWIPKYVEFATNFPRRCICIGTTNEDQFLTDTQNRRWLPLRTVGVDVEAIVRDRDQLWAEGLAVWLDDGIKWETAETLARDNQDEYKVIDQWEPVVSQWLVDNPTAEKFKTHDVLVQALGLDIRHISRVQETRVCSLLKAIGYEQKPIRTKGKKVYRGWVKKRLDI